MNDLIHILDAQNDKILGVLTTKTADYWADERTDSMTNQDTFDFVANAQLEVSALLQNRTRLLLQDEDGIFREYIIFYCEQYRRTEKTVRSNASWGDLAKAKIVVPQTLTGATAASAAQVALVYTEWQAGTIDFNGTASIVIEKHTNPLDLLNQIATTFGLEISYRVEVSGNKVTGRYIDMRLPDDVFDGKEVVFAKDLQTVRRKEDGAAIVTALMGLGPVKEDGTRLSVTVYDDNAKLRWARNGLDLIQPYEPSSSDTSMDLTTLTTLTSNELQKRIDSIVSYECEASSIEQVPGLEHEKIRRGNTIRIKDDGFQPPLYVQAKITEVKREQSTGEIKSFQIGNFRSYNKSDLEDQISGLKDYILDRVKKMLTSNITSDAGTVFKNNTGTANLTAKAYISGQEVDADGSLYTYSWIKKDKTGAVVAGYSKTTKTIAVTAAEVTDAATFVCTITTSAGITTTPQITITDVNDGGNGAPGYVHIAYATNATGTAGFSTSDATNKNYMGQYSDNTATASTDPTKYTWAKIQADPPPVQVLTWNLTNVTADSQGRLWKSGGTNATWGDAQAYTTEAYTGGAYLSFKVAQSNKAFMFGLNTDPTLDANYTGLDYCFYIRADGQFESRLNGSSLINHGTYVAGDVFTITYDNANIKYYKNGTLLRTLTVAAGLILSIDSSFNSTATAYNVYDVYFLPAGPQGTTGPGGADAITGVLSNESATVPADNAGTVSSFVGATTTMYIFKGITDDSANWTVTAGTPSGLTGSLSGKTYTVSGMTADTGYVDLTAARSGYASITKRFTVTKAKAGDTGGTGPTGPEGPRGPEGDEASNYSRNSTFYDWTGSYPANWTAATGSAISKIASDRSSGNSVVFTIPDAATNSFIYQNTSGKNAALVDYVYMESTFKVVSGDAQAAGIMIRYYKTDASYVGVYKSYTQLLGFAPVVGKWYTVSCVIPLPSGIDSSNFDYYQYYALANNTGFGEVEAARTIYVDSLKVRPANFIETYGYLTGTVVDAWKGAAVNGVTYINGGLLQTNTVLAQHLAIGDFTNLVQANETTNSIPPDVGYGALKVSNGYLMKVDPTQGYMMLVGHLPSVFRQNDQIYFEFLGLSASTTKTGTVSVWGYDKNKAYVSGSTATSAITLTATEAKYSGTLKLTNAVWSGGTIEYFLIGISGLAANDLQVRNAIFRKMHAGEMFVDGSITATKLNVTQLSAIAAQMGNVVIGGSGNGNGTLQVLDANGEVIANLDASKGGFDSLFIGDLTSPTVTRFNDQDYTLYVNGSTGNDDNDGLTSGASKKTLQNAIDSIAKFNNGAVTISITSPGAESIIFDGYVGSGKITLNFGSNTNTLNGSFYIGGCSNDIEINDITVSASLGTVIDVWGSRFVKCNNVIVSSKAGGVGYYAGRGSNVYLTNCEGYNAAYIIYSQGLSNIYVENCKGLGTNRGMIAENGGSIYSTGTVPNGTNGIVLTQTGGQQYGSQTINAGSATPPAAPTQTTTTVTATSGDNWSALYNSWSGDGVKQGNWGYGNRSGIWIFSTTPYAAMGNVAGKTIKNMKVWIKRKSSGGSTGKVRLSIRNHNYTTKPAGIPTLSAEMCSISLGWGESGWVSIPSTYWSAFSGNTAKGIGIFTSDGSSYAVCDAVGGCKIEITYQ